MRDRYERCEVRGFSGGHLHLCRCRGAVENLFALGVAIALNKGIRGLPIYRAIFYLPSLLGASVAIAVLWRIIFAGDGLFNHLLAMLGLHLDADNEETCMAIDGDNAVFSPEYRHRGHDACVVSR